MCYSYLNNTNGDILMSKINIIRPDSTSVWDKIDTLSSAGYFNRTRWERSTQIDVLEFDDLYLDLLTHNKEYCGFKRGKSIFNHTIESTLYTNPKSNQLLFASVAHRSGDYANLTSREEFSSDTNLGENFAFSSAIINNHTSTETGRQNRQCTTLESIQLFRYDPTGKGLHFNSDEIHKMYLNKNGQEVADLYRRFFSKEVPFPHFHFCSRTMAETYNKTAEADAISLENLIIYILELINTEDTDNAINKIDFGMPFLKIKQNPDLYSTAIDIHNLEETLRSANVNLQLDQIFKHTQKITPSTRKLYGLKAVFADLVLLRILRGDYNPYIFKIPDDTFSNYIDYIGYINTNHYLEEHVSMAELQLATKIGTIQTMQLRNSKGHEKMHFNEANAYVDEFSHRLLKMVLEFSQNRQNIGGNDVPTL